MVDCWWGVVEARVPQEYNWNGYKQLFQIVRELKLKLQVDLHITCRPFCISTPFSIFFSTSCIFGVLFLHQSVERRGAEDGFWGTKLV